MYSFQIVKDLSGNEDAERGVPAGDANWSKRLLASEGRAVWSCFALVNVRCTCRMTANSTGGFGCHFFGGRVLLFPNSKVISIHRSEVTCYKKPKGLLFEK